MWSPSGNSGSTALVPGWDRCRKVRRTRLRFGRGTPPAEMLTERIERARRDRLLRQLSEGRDSLPHLFDIDDARIAAGQVLIESDAHRQWQRALEIVSHQLDHLLAR